jgi:4-hydroxy-3-methylbut-2-en-1-yl diphosphate reductase
VIHGKVKHEETQATASQALKTAGGRYLVILDRTEAEEVCAYIRGRGDRERFMARFGKAVSAGFDPDRDLGHIGLANQTTMLMSESLEIAEMLRVAMGDRYGADALAERYRAFDTICSATQERQDAVISLLDTASIDLMLVVGGYNSSNTCNLARICAERVPTYHIADVDRLTSAELIRHRPVPPSDQPLAKLPETETQGWLPLVGSVRVGLTAGASTPNNIIGMVVERLAAFTAELPRVNTDR